MFPFFNQHTLCLFSQERVECGARIAEAQFATTQTHVEMTQVLQQRQLLLMRLLAEQTRARVSEERAEELSEEQRAQVRGTALLLWGR